MNRILRHDSAFDQLLLGEIAEITHGCSVPPSAVPTGLEILKISAVTRGYFNPEERKYIRDSQELRSRFDLRQGDLLLCRTNGTLAYVGMAALVSDDLPNLIFPDKVIRVRLTSQDAHPDFVWRLLKTPFMRFKIEANARTAVGNYAIGSSDLALLELILPPLKVQRRVCAAVNVAEERANAARGQAAGIRAAAWNEASGLAWAARWPRYGRVDFE
mgnify:CR=1 FL=1